VMMATPQDLQDFALGFLICEGIVHEPSELLDLCLAPYREPMVEGTSVHATLRQSALDRLDLERRQSVGTIACGLCGTTSISAALRPLPVRNGNSPVPDVQDLTTALQTLDQQQPMKQATGAAHGAAIWPLHDHATSIIVREDAGRHTALDKAVGAWCQEGSPGPAMALTTSRCSVELVQKTALAGLVGIATVGAPTALAVRTAEHSGLMLYGRVRGGSAQRFA